MGAFVGYECAVQYWQADWEAVCARRVARRSGGLASQAAFAAHVPVPADVARFDLGALGITAETSTLMVPRAAARRHAELMSFRIWKGPLPSRPFVEAAPDIFVAAPELAFVQVACDWGIWRLVRLAYEFCGGYALCAGSPNGFRARRRLTTVARLRSAVEACRGVHGVKRARRALDYVADGSRSPKETEVAMMLCLPVPMGGHGLPMPLLNRRVTLSPTARALARSPYLSPDLLWPLSCGRGAARGGGASASPREPPKIRAVAVEYDSDAFHAGAGRLHDDASRRKAFLSMGIAALPVTHADLVDQRSLDATAHLLSEWLRVRPPTPDPRAVARGRELRSFLFGPSTRP